MPSFRCPQQTHLKETLVQLAERKTKLVENAKCKGKEIRGENGCITGRLPMAKVLAELGSPPWCYWYQLWAYQKERCERARALAPPYLYCGREFRWGSENFRLGRRGGWKKKKKVG